MTELNLDAEIRLATTPRRPGALVENWLLGLAKSGKGELADALREQIPTVVEHHGATATLRTLRAKYDAPFGRDSLTQWARAQEGA